MARFARDHPLEHEVSTIPKRTIGYVGYGVAGAAIATGAVLAFLTGAMVQGHF